MNKKGMSQIMDSLIEQMYLKKGYKIITLLDSYKETQLWSKGG